METLANSCRTMMKLSLQVGAISETLCSWWKYCNLQEESITIFCSSYLVCTVFYVRIYSEFVK
jgi:hypothetical protein